MRKKNLLIVISAVLVLFTSIGAILARNNPKATAYNYLTIFSNVIHLVDSNYVEEVEFNKVMDSALNGMVEALDSDSFFIRSDELDSYKKELEESGTKAGVGITLARRFGMVVVVSVDKDSPAAEKNIKPGDFVRTVNDQYVQNVAPFRIKQMIQGAPGTGVKISLFKSALEKPEEFTLIRRAITQPYIESYVAQPNIGYIGIKHLLPGVEAEIESKLELFRRQDIDRMVLDLRECTEEDRDTSIKVADLFVGKVPIVQISGRDGTVKTITGDDRIGFSGELLVLTDYTTAGGAEIIAGAVQDSNTGKVFGVRTFGRGGIQQLLPAGENWVVLTTQKYVTPKGKTILNNGIEPTIPYKEGVKTVDESPEVDRMLEKALDHLRHPEQKAA